MRNTFNLATVDAIALHANVTATVVVKVLEGLAETVIASSDTGLTLPGNGRIERVPSRTSTAQKRLRFRLSYKPRHDPPGSE